jgi:hypothetical protein
MLGAAAGLGSLVGGILLFGPLIERTPIHVLQLLIGLMLLLFGMGWLRKAALRAGGVISLHDEDAIFAKEAIKLKQTAPQSRHSLDLVAGITACRRGCVPLGFRCVLARRGARDCLAWRRLDGGRERRAVPWRRSFGHSIGA